MPRVGSDAWLPAVAVMTAVACGTCPVQADTFDVTLEGISFWYDGQQNMNIDLVIQPGDTVRWLWVEGFHNVVSGFPDDPDSGDLFYSGPPTDAPGTIFEFTFLDPGVYGYHCHPHGKFGMISYVTVVSAPSCPWDLDVSGGVGISDLLTLLAAWGTDPGGPPDFDGDGYVGILDLLELLANWGVCP